MPFYGVLFVFGILTKLKQTNIKDKNRSNKVLSRTQKNNIFVYSTPGIMFKNFKIIAIFLFKIVVIGKK